MEAVIWDAASMFISSPTARGMSGRGTGYPRLARRVRDQLRREIGEGDVHYRTPPKSSRDNLGHVETVKMPNGRVNHRIIIHAKLRKDLAGTSIMLVHEALHPVLRVHEIDEELDARRLTIFYFQDLVSPKRWKYRTLAGAMADSVHLSRGSQTDQLLQLSDQESFDRRNQLVDYVLMNAKYARSIKASWVRRNIDWWGGLANRWPETRSIYVFELAQEEGPENAGLIKRILESLVDASKPFRTSRRYSRYSLDAKDPVRAFGNRIGLKAGSGEDPWKIVRKGLRSLSQDPKEKRDLELLASRLSAGRGNQTIDLIDPSGPPEL